MSSWDKTPKGRAYNRERNRVNRQRKRDYLNVVKGGPCVDCGGRFPPIAMDLHHVRGDKLFSPALLTNRGWRVLKAEVEKCVLLCANCHRIRHPGVSVPTGYETRTPKYVTRLDTGRWQAYLPGTPKRHLGSFASEEEARQAVLAALSG